MKSKTILDRNDLCMDAFIDLSCAVDLLNTIECEHFEMVEMPEGWGDSLTYECVSRKIHAVSNILNNALNMLSIAENNEAGDYFNAQVELMSSIIRQKREQQPRKAVTA